MHSTMISFHRHLSKGYKEGDTWRKNPSDSWCNAEFSFYFQAYSVYKKKIERKTNLFKRNLDE